MKNDDDSAEIIRLYQNERLAMRAVSLKTGVPKRRVRSTLDRAGIIRPPGQQRRINDKQYAAVLTACTTGGMTRTAAAAAAGISTAAVKIALRKHGAVLQSAPGMLSAAQAEAAGVPAREARMLARYGLIRTVRGTARGHRLYNAEDVKAMAARRKAVLE